MSVKRIMMIVYNKKNCMILAFLIKNILSISYKYIEKGQ